MTDKRFKCMLIYLSSLMFRYIDGVSVTYFYFFVLKVFFFSLKRVKFSQIYRGTEEGGTIRFFLKQIIKELKTLKCNRD